jgi:hypothetical protein
MPVDPTRLLSFIREIDQTPHDALKTFDREMLMRIRQELMAHKREVDKAVLRLSFVDEQQLN